jgi:DNA-binding response OmpR family regulator
MDQEKILISVQEHSVAKNIEDTLVNSGFSVILSDPIFSSTTSLALESNPDLIVISVSLDFDYAGIDAIKKIKNKLTVPVIYLSFSDDIEAYNKAKATNPIAYFSMPFEIENVLRTIEIGLTNHKLQQEIVDAHNKYEMVIKAAKAGVYEIDPATFEIDGEETFAEVFGYTTQEVKDNGWGTLLQLMILIERKKLYQIYYKAKLNLTRLNIEL